jgi:hypothetical protein
MGAARSAGNAELLNAGLFRLMNETSTAVSDAAAQARRIREQLPAHGLFAGHEWRIAPEPFGVGPKLAKELELLGRVLLQFNRAVNLLYRLSVAGKQPEWVAEWLDRGKPAELIELQRASVFKNDLPRVIRPDLLLTEEGISLIELDSVPGGIGLTAWLNEVYSTGNGASKGGERDAFEPEAILNSSDASAIVLGGARGMQEGFAGIFGEAPSVHIVISKEAGTYRPEMEWVAERLGRRFAVRDTQFTGFGDGDAVYRFFELFDLANVPSARDIFRLAQEKRIRLSPPPKPIFEEKMLFALLWNRNLREFWRQELGEKFLQKLQSIVPYTWLVDPTPLPPMAAIPGLNLTDWSQLKSLSQRERSLILKVSGFSESAWGSRGVFLGSDLPLEKWSEAVDRAIRCAAISPFVLQPYAKPRIVESAWFDFVQNKLVPMKGRVRLCPYYFVQGEADAARARLGGALATICPADKKIIHGMKDAILVPCSE